MNAKISIKLLPYVLRYAQKHGYEQTLSEIQSFKAA